MNVLNAKKEESKEKFSGNMECGEGQNAIIWGLNRDKE